jgi:hypothetical protein
VVAVTVLAAAVAALAYLVSFEAIGAYVAGIGALPAWLRWCGPLLVDTFITLGTLFLLWLALSGIPLRRVWDAWYAWALIAAATLASAYLNAAHARHAGMPAWLPAQSLWPCWPVCICWCCCCCGCWPGPHRRPTPPLRLEW